jgi:hypothetical protein
MKRFNLLDVLYLLALRLVGYQVSSPTIKDDHWSALAAHRWLGHLAVVGRSWKV